MSPPATAPATPPPTAAPAMPRVAVVQDGSRLNYAVPVTLWQRQALSRMFAEWYLRPSIGSFLAAKLADRIRSGAGRRLIERHHPALKGAPIITNLALAYKIARAAGTSRFQTAEDHYAFGSDLVAKWVSAEGFGDANALFGFIRNISPTLLASARRAGLKTVCDQMIAPMFEEQRQARLQADRFPEWATSSAPCNAQLVEQIEAASWAECDRITCASDYVRDGLLNKGVAWEKISVLPYPIDVLRFPEVDRTSRPGPLTVGFIGMPSLRKGTPYFMQVAHRLAASSIRFVLVGHLQIDRALVTARNVDVIGAVPRGEISQWLARFDLLLFPSTCEGSAVAVMEAMASGLPIVTTPNSGTAVRHGLDGFIHPYDDVDALAASVERLATDAALRLELGQNARRRAASYSLDLYGDQLLALFKNLL